LNLLTHKLTDTANEQPLENL